MPLFGSKSPNIEDTLFTLKFTTKQLERSAKKCEKEESAQRTKIKRAMEKGNVEGARIYAENAIRKKNEGLNYLRLASRVDAVANRVQTAMTMKTLTKNLGGVVQGLDQVMQSMDLEKITAVMEKFESQFEDLDVHSQVMEGAMGNATTLSTPQDQVESLIKQVADESGMDVLDQLSTAKVGSTVPQNQATVPSLTSRQEDELSKRLTELRS
ncbi:charged multivesicular body protein 1a-like [Dysidea avara]|uniref:charged multivesicular body protein 1a-like n=1 Tax=Dysidea avara TaxID=196820 RepID=UPI00332582CD